MASVAVVTFKFHEETDQKVYQKMNQHKQNARIVFNSMSTENNETETFHKKVVKMSTQNIAKCTDCNACAA